MKYFTEQELRIENAPKNIKENMNELVLNVLDPLRELAGRLKVSSGYRDKEYNKRVHGVWNSQHCFGQACDIVPLDSSTINTFLKLINNFEYDQAIYETNDKGNVWIHVSYNKKNNRKQKLRAFKILDFKTGKKKWDYIPFQI